MHGDEGAHHVAVFVFEDVAVVHVPAAVGGEADSDFGDLVGLTRTVSLRPRSLSSMVSLSSSSGSRSKVTVAVMARSSMPCSGIW